MRKGLLRTHSVIAPSGVSAARRQIFPLPLSLSLSPSALSLSKSAEEMVGEFGDEVGMDISLNDIKEKEKKGKQGRAKDDRGEEGTHEDMKETKERGNARDPKRQQTPNNEEPCPSVSLPEYTTTTSASPSHTKSTTTTAKTSPSTNVSSTSHSQRPTTKRGSRSTRFGPDVIGLSRVVGGGGGVAISATEYTSAGILPVNHPRVAAAHRTCLLFHCEFSKNRGPKMMRHVRKMDRRLHIERYVRGPG